MPPPLHGFHHLTAITANARTNLDFYTRILGLRLVKKTVNQDDVRVYHLFYGDGAASPGSDITFFEWALPPARRGSRSISRTGFRVARGSLGWWHERLAGQDLNVIAFDAVDGRPSLMFDDDEGQRLLLIADDMAPSYPWDKSPIPPEHQLRGLGPIIMTVSDLDPTAAFLTKVMGMRAVRTYAFPLDEGQPVTVFAMGEGGTAAELHVRADGQAPFAREGAGGVHHLAFRTPDNTSLAAWAAHLRTLNIPFSGEIDRYYFRSLYFREPGRVLFEIATDGPGFTVDEPLETLGEALSLPPFLAARRAEIEAGLHPL